MIPYQRGAMLEPMFEAQQQLVRERVASLAEQNRDDLETVAQLLSKITQLPSEQVKPQLHTLMASLVELQEASFHTTATPQEWSRRFSEWVAAHRGRNFPCLSDEAIARESIYGDER
jgi:phosphoserine phosphatase